MKNCEQTSEREEEYDPNIHYHIMIGPDYAKTVCGHIPTSPNAMIPEREIPESNRCQKCQKDAWKFGM